jgi:membrane protease YdiL (CAAX protease family)
MAMGIVATWIYNNTRGSLLMVALFHAANDSMSQFQGSDIRLFNLSIYVWCAAAIVLLIIFGARHLSRKPDSEIAHAIILPES